MTRAQFDYGNARDNIPEYFPRMEATHEATAPTCRGYWSNGVLVPLSVADDTLCDANGVPAGVHWQSFHDWNAERRTYLHGQRVLTYSPTRAAEIIAATNDVHCHWDAEREVFVTWERRDWERDAAKNK